MKSIHRDLDQVALIDVFNAADTIIADLEPDTTVLFLNYGEYWPTESISKRLASIAHLVKAIKLAKPDLKIFFLVDSWWEKYDAQIKKIAFDDVLYIDYFIYRIHKELLEHNRSPVAYRWNSNSNKFLFLTGFPYRFNRIRLLKKLDEVGLMSNAEWSLHCDDQDLVTKARMHQLVPEMSTTELNNLISKYRRNPDQITLRSTDGGYNGLPYNVKLYTDTGFSVIPESLYDSKYHPWFTEKTWKAIANHHPFIIAGVPGSLSKLNQMGIVTFDEFLLVKNYDTIECPEARLDAIVANIGWWQQNIHKYKYAINESVIHNREVFGNLYLENAERIRQFCTRNDFEYLANDLIATEDRRPDIYPSDQVEAEMHRNRIFNNFYNSIKDSSWPECRSEKEFANLPDYIQKECEDVFGYVKLTK